jgi:hypothetical protein
MPKIIVSSALTFLDTTDQNQLSAYLTSNFATVQTCTSDREVYSPDWEKTPLEIQLHAFYDGADYNDKLESGQITWFVKDGNQDANKIANGGNYNIIDHTKLIVQKNVLKDCTSDTVTFICEVTLNEVDVMTVQMTYTLISDTKAVSFYLGMPDGDTFTNQTGTRQIIAYAHRGVEEIQAGTSGTIDSETATFVWYKYNTSGEWEVDTDDVDDHDSKKLTIQGTSVTNIASFKCVMTYKGVEYIGVATVRDITDTYISEIFTIGGDVFKNGIGGSAAYILVRKNGQADEEVDPLVGEISTTNGAANNGDYWYQIDHDNDQIIYKQYQSGSWRTISSIPQELVYTWTLMDKEGNAKNFSNGSSTKTGKVIYVSCSDIDDTGTVQCVVSSKD